MSAGVGFFFGLVADIQYASKEDTYTEGRCQRYGEVPAKLFDAVSSWQHNEPPLKFVLSLGDLVDGRPTQVSRLLLDTNKNLAQTTCLLCRQRLIKIIR